MWSGCGVWWLRCGCGGSGSAKIQISNSEREEAVRKVVDLNYIFQNDNFHPNCD